MLNYYSVTEAANILRVKDETVRRYIRQGILTASKLSGSSYIISEDSINLFVTETSTGRVNDIDISKIFNENGVTIKKDSISNKNIGDIIGWHDISSIYGVDSGKGIKINYNGNYAVIITDVQFKNANNIYPDVFSCQDDKLDPYTLYYIGEGKKGHMDPENPRNKFIINSIENNSLLIVYQYLDKNHYSNCGIFQLQSISKAMQPDSDNVLREVIIFKLKPCLI